MRWLFPSVDRYLLRGITFSSWGFRCFGCDTFLGFCTIEVFRKVLSVLISFLWVLLWISRVAIWGGRVGFRVGWFGSPWVRCWSWGWWSFLWVFWFPVMIFRWRFLTFRTCPWDFLRDRRWSVWRFLVLLWFFQLLRGFLWVWSEFLLVCFELLRTWFFHCWGYLYDCWVEWWVLWHLFLEFWFSFLVIFSRRWRRWAFRLVRLLLFMIFHVSSWVRWVWLIAFLGALPFLCWLFIRTALFFRVRLCWVCSDRWLLRFVRWSKWICYRCWLSTWFRLIWMREFSLQLAWCRSWGFRIPLGSVLMPIFAILAVIIVF